MRIVIFTLAYSILSSFAFEVIAQSPEIDFGADTSDFAFDDICDDPRFAGPGVTPDVDWDSAGRDATDCKNAVAKEQARFWFDPLNLKPVQCDKVDFGNDSSNDANDTTCDDPRFLSFNSLGLNLPENIKSDASDCRHACRFGLLYQRPEK